MRKLLASALLLAASSAAFAQYPQRPVQLIVPWGAGGGTDATARIIATLLEKELKQPFNVVNRTGGSGVVGHDAIAKASPDGYTIGLITVEITMMHHVGLTPAQAHRLHADRPGERRPGRRARARRLPLQEQRRSCWPRSRRTRASSRPRAPGRAASGISRSQGCSRTRASIRTRSPGCHRRAPRPACRTWWPAASRSCPARSPRRAR